MSELHLSCRARADGQNRKQSRNLTRQARFYAADVVCGEFIGECFSWKRVLSKLLFVLVVGLLVNSSAV